jgi:hypothetical protein
MTAPTNQDAEVLNYLLTQKSTTSLNLVMNGMLRSNQIKNDSVLDVLVYYMFLYFDYLVFQLRRCGI